jgi:hypothetical protein
MNRKSLFAFQLLYQLSAQLSTLHSTQPSVPSRSQP